MGMLDVLRGTYVALPMPARNAVAPLLAKLPVSLRYGGAYHRLREDLVRSDGDPAFVRARVHDLLRRVLAAAAVTKHYGPLLRLADIDAALPFEELLVRTSSLPVLSRELVSNDPASFLAKPIRFLDERRTSGSSGRPPTVLYLDKDRSVREMAFLHHFWSRMGYATGDGRALLTGTLRYAAAGGEYGFDPALRELWLNAGRLDAATMDRHLDHMDRHRLPFLFGMPSAMTVLALHMRRIGRTRPGYMKGVISASETLFPHQRRLIADAFGTPVRAFYGLTERVAIADEVAPDVYAFHPFYGLAELVDDSGNQVTRAGGRGRLVATGLGNVGMPLIRYDTGDRARLVESPSWDNGWRLVVSGIRSKWSQEFLVSASGALVPVSVALPEAGAGLIREFQFAQHEPGRAVLRVVSLPGAARDEIEHVMLDAVRVVVGPQLHLVLEIVDEIAAGPNDKRRFVDQRLDLASYGWFADDAVAAEC
jgi:phenylacetate-CoA ligase